MKNKLTLYFIAAFYLCSTFAFADPGITDPEGTLENTDATAVAAPINENLWILALMGLVFVFMRLKKRNSTKIY